MSEAHPFFDFIVYPWSRPDAREFHRALYSRIQSKALIAHWYKKCSEDLSPLNLDQTPALVWTDALDALVGARLLKQLCELILADAAQVNIHPQTQAVIDAKSAITTAVLPTGGIFVNRKLLREKLQKLSAPAAAPSVLLVRGRERSGNSWSENLVRVVAASYGAIPVYLFEGFVVSVKDVVDSLFTAVGKPGYVEPADTTEHGWYRNVCRRLWGFAQENRKVYWIVIDDLGTPEAPRLDAEIKSFFDQFVLMMGNSAMSQWFRLILLQYPEGDVPTRWREDVWVEDIPQVTEIDETAVVEFVQAAALERSKQLSSDEAQRIASEVFEAIKDSKPPDRLRAINAELRRRIEQL
jgi:hypothetical protein